MKNVTPENNWTMMMKALGLAIGTVVIIAFFKIAFDAFLSVSGLIIPLMIIYFLLFKFGNKN